VSPNWRFKGTRGGGAVSDINTGIPVVAGQFHFLAMAPNILGGLDGYVDGVYIGSIAAAATSQALLEPIFYVDDGGLAAGNAINYDLDLLAVWQ